MTSVGMRAGAALGWDTPWSSSFAEAGYSLSETHNHDSGESGRWHAQCKCLSPSSPDSQRPRHASTS